MAATEQVADLRELALFSDASPGPLQALAAELRRKAIPLGDTLMRQGEPADWFAIVVSGEADIFQLVDGEATPVAEAGPGSILGELALLGGAPRNALVVARTPMRVLLGSRHAFSLLLEIEGVGEQVVKRATQKLASHVSHAHTALRDGSPVLVRPLLPDDRDQMALAVDQLSDESRRRRFFTGGKVPSRTIDYLVDLDYVDHFAWLAMEPDGERRGVGVGRFIRLHDEPHVAEFAVTVADPFQRQGAGRLLIGAIAAAAMAADVQELEGNALADNTPIQNLLRAAGAKWRVSEPGVLTTRVEVSRMLGMIDDELAHDLTRSAAATMAAARLPLVRPPRVDDA